MKIKQILIVSGISALVLVGVFAAGRYSKPDKVVTITEKAETKVEWKTRVVYKYVKKKQDKETVTTTKPDGTVVVVEKEHTETETTKDATTSGGSKSDKTESTKTEIVNAKPQWRIGAKVGVLLNGGLSDPTASFVYGLSADRRLLGPVWMGAFVLTNSGVANSDGSSGSALVTGLQLNLEF